MLEASVDKRKLIRNITRKKSILRGWHLNGWSVFFSLTNYVGDISNIQVHYTYQQYFDLYVICPEWYAFIKYWCRLKYI